MEKVKGVHNILHVSFFDPNLPGGTQQGPPDSIVARDNQEYEIDRIVSHKKKRGKTVYQVRWSGYNATKDDWLSEKDLSNASDLL